MRLKDISINNLRRRKGKVFFLILGLTIGITTVVTLISITRMMNEDIANKLDAFGANIVILPRSDDLSLSYGGMNVGGVALDTQTLRDSDVPKIRQIEVRENISIVSPKILGVVEIEGKNVLLMGVLFPDEIRLKKWWKIHGSIPKTQNDVLLGNEVAVKLFKSAGDTLTIYGKEVRVSGVLDETGSQDDYLILGDLTFVQELTKKPGVLLIGGLIVFTNMMASVNERKREIGIFRAIGFRKSHVVRIIFLEALIVGLMAGIMGYLLGLGISQVIGPMITGMKGGRTFIDPMLAIEVIFLSAIIGVLSSAYPALHASKMDPTEALRAL